MASGEARDEAPAGAAAEPERVEDVVAARVQAERIARGWSTATVAEKMTALGYPMNQSAVWRIESGEPRRRINLDEAVGFSVLFEVDLESLMWPQGAVLTADANRLLKRYVNQWLDWRDAERRLTHMRVAFEAYTTQHPEEKELLEALTVACINVLTEGRNAGAPDRTYPASELSATLAAQLRHPSILNAVLRWLDPRNPDEPPPPGLTF